MKRLLALCLIAGLTGFAQAELVTQEQVTPAAGQAVKKNPAARKEPSAAPPPINTLTEEALPAAITPAQDFLKALDLPVQETPAWLCERWPDQAFLDRRSSPDMLQGLSFLAGVLSWHNGPDTEVFPALSIRYHIKQAQMTPDAIEVGGALPMSVSGGFHQEMINFGGVSYQARIKSAAEAHLAGVWEFWKQDWIIPELAVGLSVGRFRNAADSTGQAGFPMSETHTSVSQLDQLGATFPITPSVAFHADAGYVRYANHLRDPVNNDFDLFVSALTFRAVLQVKL